MRRFTTRFPILLVLTIALNGVGRSYAQDPALNTILVLSDYNPRIEVQVEIPQGTQGSVRLELIDVSLSVTDAAGELMLTSEDSALREIEILFEANSSTHQIAVQRLPDVTTGYVRITAAPELKLMEVSPNITPIELTLQQSTVVTPVDFSVAPAGMLEIQQIENAAYTRVVKTDGSAILNLHSTSIEQVRVILAGNSYQLQMDNSVAYPIIQAQVEIALLDQTAALMQPVAAPAPSSTTTICTGTVNFEQVNQRSGPGINYTITGDVRQTTELPVGGWNAARDWLLVSTDYGSAWMYATYLDLAGDCANLPVY